MSDVRIAHAGPAPEPTAAEPAAAAARPAAAPPPPTPSQQIVADANAVIRFKDSRGRTIGIRRMGVVDRARMMDLLGPERSRNDAFLSFAFPCLVCCEIDGDLLSPLTAPSRRAGFDVALEGVMARLGDEGMEAVNKAIVEHWTPKTDDDDPKAAVKN